jgi:hypothetical protein
LNETKIEPSMPVSNAMIIGAAIEKPSWSL